jgi:tRNA pseudouridine38-40 synthase
LFEGEGFLYKMVRMLVGAMVRCGQGACSLEDLRERLERPDNSRKSPMAAPPDGLYLVEVRYPGGEK